MEPKMVAIHGVEPELWHAVKVAAATNGKGISEYVKDVLRKATARKEK